MMSTTSERPSIASVHRNGCFSRPEESQEAYLRAASTWTVSDKEEEWDFPPIVKKTFAERFGVDLQKIPVEISSKGLMPWELACCWIDQDGRGAIQIRPNDRPLKLVQSEAILTHEAVHAVRGRLFSSVFEEHCAYAACYDAFPHTFPGWRAFLGPLFTSPKEIIIILIIVWGTWGVPMLFDWDIPYSLLFCLSLSSLFFPFMRLLNRWRVWRKALKNIAGEWPNKEWKLMIRLSDQEIRWLATLKKSTVRDAIHKKAGQEWRWEYFLEEILD
jgi:hypothetical protein